MKRFTQYLYEYQKEKRIRNIGFVKVEQRGKSSVLQMQGRGIAVKSNEELKIYLFYKTGERYEAVYQGAISKKTPILSCTLEFTAEDIGNAETMEDIAGILLLEPDGKRYAAVWNGEAIDVEGISTEMKRVEPKSEDVQKREPEAEPVQTQEPEVLEAAEVAEEEEVLQIQVEETPGPKNICEKIQRKDLARLPRKGLEACQ